MLIKSETTTRESNYGKNKGDYDSEYNRKVCSPNIHLSRTKRLRLVILFNNVGSKQSWRFRRH